MSVDLSDYLSSFQNEISPPGQNLYPNMSNNEAVSRLVDAFWELRLSGLDFLSQWTCSEDGIITPYSNGTNANILTLPAGWYTDNNSGDIGREIIQAIILFAGFRVVLTAYQNITTMTSSRAGNVSYETQHSAQVLVGVLNALREKMKIVLTRLSDLGTTTVTAVDMVMQKTENEFEGFTWWPRG